MSPIELAEQVEATGPDRELDRKVAIALGWQERRVTRLGLAGRTPGSWLWFPPDEKWGDRGSRNPPRFTGPRKRDWTIAALRARAALIKQESPVRTKQVFKTDLKTASATDEKPL